MRDIEAAVSQLTKAQQQFESANNAAKQASRDLCDATNRLNDAQRTFDTVVEEIKKEAPGGDWKSDRAPKHKV